MKNLTGGVFDLAGGMHSTECHCSNNCELFSMCQLVRLPTNMPMVTFT